MSKTSINTDAVYQASERFTTEAVPQATTARTNVADLANGQVSQSKWSAEAGPDGFRQKYHTYLHDLEATLVLLEEELGDFAQALATTASSYLQTDSEVSDAADTLWSNYRSQISDNTDLQTSSQPESWYKHAQPSASEPDLLVPTSAAKLPDSEMPFPGGEQKPAENTGGL